MRTGAVTLADRAPARSALLAIWAAFAIMICVARPAVAQTIKLDPQLEKEVRKCSVRGRCSDSEMKALVARQLQDLGGKFESLTQELQRANGELDRQNSAIERAERALDEETTELKNSNRKSRQDTASPQE